MKSSSFISTVSLLVPKLKTFLLIVFYNGKILMGCCKNSTRRSFLECDISFNVENFHSVIIKRTKEKRE